MPAEAGRGFEEKGEESPWCIQCGDFLKWPYHDECHGCLNAGGRPAETVTFRSVHWDMAVLHAVIRRKVGVWEARHPGWALVPDMQRYWEDSTHPSKYVDRETGMGRKLAWTRFRVERRHPRGLRVWAGEEAVGEPPARQDGDARRLLGVDGPRRSRTWLLVPGQRPVRVMHPERYGAQEQTHE